MNEPSRNVAATRAAPFFRDALKRIAIYATETLPDPETGRSRFRVTLGMLLRFNIVFCGALALFVWNSRTQNRTAEGNRCMQCATNLSQIRLALLSYHNTYGSFPPAHVDDANGKPLHSWRVLILPFLGEPTLYGMYNFNEPWDGPSNRWLLNSMPDVYACPSGHALNSGGRGTNYVVMTGPGTIFPDGATVELADIIDGPESTLTAAEIDNADILWTEPRDLDLRTMSILVNDPKRAGISSQHPGGANVLLADGTVRFLSAMVTPAELATLMTIGGQEPIDVDAVLSRK